MNKAISIIHGASITLTPQIISALAEMGTVELSRRENGTNGAVSQNADGAHVVGRDLVVARAALASARIRIAIPDPARFEIPLEMAKQLVDLATAHIEDVITGILAGRYAPQENQDLPGKMEALGVARTVYEVTVAELHARGSVLKEIMETARGARQAFAVIAQGPSEAESQAIASEWFGRMACLILPTDPSGTPGSHPMAASRLFDDAFGEAATADTSLHCRRAALKASVLAEFRETGDPLVDRRAIANKIGDAAREMEDEAVLGLDASGNVLQWDKRNGVPYTSGESLGEWGIHNLRAGDLKLVGVTVEAWQSACDEASQSEAAA